MSHYKEGKYPMLEKELSKLSNNINDQYSTDLEKHDAICAFLGISCEAYVQILNVVQSKGLKKVVDIGCCYGFQSEIFTSENIEYEGIEGYVPEEDMYRRDELTFTKAVYPFSYEAGDDTVAISNLCLGWNCYLREDNSLEKQFSQLSKDFKQAIIVIQNDNFEKIKHLFSTIEVIRPGSISSLVYFENEVA